MCEAGGGEEGGGDERERQCHHHSAGEGTHTHTHTHLANHFLLQISSLERELQIQSEALEVRIAE